MSKWERFYSQHSHVKVGEANLGTSSPEGDWGRSIDKPFKINGVPLKDIVTTSGNKFETEEDVKRFFKTIILKDMEIGEVAKDKIVDYLYKSFHQGGYMRIVSGPLQKIFTDDSGNQLLNTSGRPEGFVRETNLITTERGFKIQELFTSKIMIASNVLNNDILKKECAKDAEQGTRIFPDKGNDFVIKAEATIDLDFSKRPDAPDMTVKSNRISYGNSVIKSIFDKRNLGQKIVDFFKNLFNLNSVKVLSPASENKVTLPEGRNDPPQLR
ncbi:hypothetical protein [Legionella yabuuchiae]|uniref:hypothetical protein n=1 Tax=Legionella yabuuchiae TaxID=376727 RepID=UPI0010547832|nr:hypothetical protein [Legionella yabuuchiae]